MGSGRSWVPIQKYVWWDRNRPLVTRATKNSIGPTAKLLEALCRGQSLGPIQVIIFDGGQIFTVLTWVRKKVWRQMFWWGILRKRFIRTTSNRLWQVVQHVNQKRWWLYKVWAPLKSIIFDGAQIYTDYTVLTGVRKNVWRPMFWGGIWRKRFIWTKDGDSIIFGPHWKLGSNLHSVDLSQKECTEANVRASTGQHINSTNPELESC